MKTLKNSDLKLASEEKSFKDIAVLVVKARGLYPQAKKIGTEDLLGPLTSLYYDGLNAVSAADNQNAKTIWDEEIVGKEVYSFIEEHGTTLEEGIKKWKEKKLEALRADQDSEEIAFEQNSEKLEHLLDNFFNLQLAHGNYEALNNRYYGSTNPELLVYQIVEPLVNTVVLKKIGCCNCAASCNEQSKALAGHMEIETPWMTTIFAPSGVVFWFNFVPFFVRERKTCATLKVPP